MLSFSIRIFRFGYDLKSVNNRRFSEKVTRKHSNYFSQQRGYLQKNISFFVMRLSFSKLTNIVRCHMRKNGKCGILVSIEVGFGDPRVVFKQEHLRCTSPKYSLSMVCCLLWTVRVTITAMLLLTEELCYIR